MRSAVRDYYGKVLKKSTDLKTNACCTINKYPQAIKNIMNNIHEDILSSYYGCGLIIPDQLKNAKVMDLGCGTGRDVYILSKLVGENGKVVGIDMTDEQLDKANKYKEFQREKFEYKQSNVTFIKGFIEELDDLNLEKNSFDVIVSNCVVNLSPNKEKVFQNIYNLLKPGGEFYFSDVYSSVRIPNELKNDNVLWGECLSGALYWNDFLNIAKKYGFIDPRLVTSSPITIQNKKLEEKIGHIDFFSATYRLFKIPDLLEPDCEDYGQAVIYKGGIENSENYWDLDNHHRMKKNKITPVCGNTWNILHSSRFKSHFDFIGNFSQHFGIFEGCGKNMPFSNDSNNNCC